jgi:hypothetical protein
MNTFLFLYDRFYVQMLFGAALQALIAFVLGATGIIQLSVFQQLTASGLILISCFAVTLFAEKPWFSGFGMAIQAFITATLGMFSIMNISALQQLVFCAVYLFILYLLCQNENLNRKVATIQPTITIVPETPEEEVYICTYCRTRSKINTGPCKQCGYPLS